MEDDIKNFNSIMKFYSSNDTIMMSSYYRMCEFSESPEGDEINFSNS